VSGEPERASLRWPPEDPAAHGERKRWRKGRVAAISPEIIKRLHEECGIEVIDTPRSDELIFLGD
jgi:hypothetical protein